MRTSILLSLLCGSLLCGCQQTSPQHAGPTQSLMPEKITLAYAVSPSATLIQIAIKRGYFSDEGLRVIPQPHPFGKPALESMLEGKADLATCTETPLAFAAGNGKKFSVVTTVSTTTRDVAIVARKDQGVTSPQQLKGRRVGVPKGTNADFFLSGFLNLHGLQRDDVTVVGMKPDDMSSALMTGAVDAVATFQPFLNQLRQQLANRGGIFYGDPIYTEFFVLSANNDFVVKYPAAVKKILKALAKAERYVKQDPSGARTIVTEFTGLQDTLLSEIWGGLDFSLKLDEPLLVALEDETRWAIENKLVHIKDVGNYLDYLYLDGLKSVKPEAVRIRR